MPIHPIAQRIDTTDRLTVTDLYAAGVVVADRLGHGCADVLDALGITRDALVEAALTAPAQRAASHRTVVPRMAGRRVS